MQRKPKINVIMATTQLTKAQWTLVQLFSRVTSEKEDAELRKLLSDF